MKQRFLPLVLTTLTAILAAPPAPAREPFAAEGLEDVERYVLPPVDAASHYGPLRNHPAQRKRR